MPSPIRRLATLLWLPKKDDPRTQETVRVPRTPAAPIAPSNSLPSIRIADPRTNGASTRWARICSSLGPGIDVSGLLARAARHNEAARDALESWSEALESELHSARGLQKWSTARVYVPRKSPQDKAAPAWGQLGQVAGLAMLHSSHSDQVPPSADLVGLPSVVSTRSVATQVPSRTRLSQFGLTSGGNKDLCLLDIIHAMRRARSVVNRESAQAWTSLRVESIDEAEPKPDLGNVQVLMQVLLVPEDLTETTMLQFDCIGRHINFPADVTALGSTEWFRTVDKEHPVILLPLSAVMSPGSNAQTLAFLADRQRSPVFRQRYEEPASELHIVHVVLVDPISNKSPQEASTDRFTTLKDAVEFLHGMAEKIAVK